jgi:hypothetical protein
MYTPSRTIRFLVRALLVLAGLGVLIAVIVFWFADPLQRRAPSDESIASLFQSHQMEFERLRQMATEDAHGHILWYFSESSIGQIPAESRRQEYQKLLSLRSGLTVAVNYDDNVRFIFAIGGLSAIGPGWVKGIQYSRDISKVGVRVATLDNQRRFPEGVYLKELRPDWFILFQRDD